MKLVSYHFRDKTEGWIHFSVKYSCDDGKEIQRLFSEDPFMKSFLSELNLRPSCYHCMFKGNAVPSDLLIGDYWGVQTKHPELYDKDGVSIVVTNTEPGKILLENIHASVSINEIPMEDATQPAMTSSAPIPKHRDAFSRYMQAGESFSEAINRLLPQKKHTFVRRAWRFAKRKIARILGQKQNNVSVPVLAPFHSWYIVDPQNDFSAKQSCCGCSACQMVCPVHAIVMKQDEEGFPYPSIENDVCIHCDACRRVCPILAESSKERKTEPFHPSHVYAVRNNDDKVRKQSSSGGVFVPLCEFILQQQGVVYGCVMDYGADGPKAKHVRATTRQEVTAMMGSKYLQSEIGDCYRLVKQDLQDGKHVLFSGTPCQIAGLQHFLLAKNDVGKSQVSDTIHEAYPLLVTVAVVCHGVPSPLVFKKYVNETILQTR